jgi:L-aspartate oxidase
MNTRVLEHSLAIDIVTDANGRAAGVTVLRDDGSIEYAMSGTTVLANGGAGQLWAVTSNPAGATADGVAMALRAGVTLADLEFAQFHPTVLDVQGVEPFLISEAVRGEGAWLLNSAGERFMLAIDERAELAPRNVVASAIERQLATIPDNRVYLSLTHLNPVMVAERFPTISAHLAAVGLDLARDPIPVAPAAHYFMGGVAANTLGETSLTGLLAIGEVSCTGVHGANRLASNSLLEGLVFGINAADRLADTGFPVPGEVPEIAAPPATSAVDVEAQKRDIQRTMTRHVGVMRSREGLESAMAHLSRQASWPIAIERDALIVRNMREVALQVATSALGREESRGGHVRSDFPERDPALDGQHQMLRKIDERTIERWWGPLPD